MVTHRPSVNDVVYRQLCRVSSIRSVAVTTISLIVDFLLVVDVTAGSTEQCADHRATQCSDACSDRRASDRFAPRVLAVIIVVIVITTVAITSVIVIVVIPRRDIVSTPAASVLRQRARSGGGQQQAENYHQNHALFHYLGHLFLLFSFWEQQQPAVNSTVPTPHRTNIYSRRARQQQPPRPLGLVNE